MPIFQGLFLGFLLGSIVTMICIWIAGGSLYATDEDDEAEDERQPVKEAPVLRLVTSYREDDHDPQQH